MIKISLLDLLLRIFPESFLFIFASYLFSNKAVDKKRIILSVSILSISIYFVRLLPIQFGVHIILNGIVYVILCVEVNGILLEKSVKYSLVLIAMLSLSEKLNAIILNEVFGGSVQAILNDSLLKNISTIPSIILFFLEILICYKILHKRRNNEFI